MPSRSLNVLNGSIKKKLSVSDVIVSQKGSNVDRKLNFFGRDYHYTCCLCTKIHISGKIPQRLKMLLKRSACFNTEQACD